MVLKNYIFSKKSIALKKITKQIRQAKKRIIVIISFVLINYPTSEIPI
jgi:hypothetical protein